MRRGWLVAVTVAALLGGCGGGGEDDAPLSKREYERQFKAVLAKAEKQPRLTPPKDASLPQQGEVIDQGLDRLKETAAELGRLEPPKEVASAHRDLVGGMRGIATDGAKVVAAMKAGDRRRLAKLLPDKGGAAFASPATVRKVLRARSEFQRKGYDLAGTTTGLP